MSLPAYPDYRATGTGWLGDVPAHWAIKPLWTLFRRTKRVGFEEEQLLSVYRDYGVVPKASRDDNNNKPSDDLSVYQLVLPGDLAINKMKAWQGSVAISEHKGIVSPAYFVFEAIHGEEDRYLHYLLRSPRYITGYLSLSKGIRVSQWDLEPQQHSRMPVLLPPIEEQTAIATFLDRETAKIDGLIAEQEKLLLLLAEKRQATISQAVTKGLNPDAPMKDSGVEWLGEVPAHWEVVGLTKYISSVVDYRGRTPTKVDDGVFLVTAKNIRNGTIDYEASQEYISSNEYDEVMRRGHPAIGDVLFTTEAPLGQVAQVDRTHIALAQRVIKFRGDDGILNNSFLKYWLMGSYCQFNLELLATGSTALGIKGSKVGQVRLCLPPIKEQNAIADFLDAEIRRVDDLNEEATRAIELLKERRTALISAAVTGKIDVRHLADQEAT
jgi:type I restriction enzyme, S subunit